MEGGTAAVVYIDYKMKLDPIRHRESSAQFYGKRGMSWHGSAVFFRPCEQEKEKRRQ